MSKLLEGPIRGIIVKVSFCDIVRCVVCSIPVGVFAFIIVPIAGGCYVAVPIVANDYRIIG
ncbi:MAG: hypothetical protein QXH03_05595 [Candidatus Bathyarchaeia archaeon]